jgi:hypothetical protein
MARKLAEETPHIQMALTSITESRSKQSKIIPLAPPTHGYRRLTSLSQSQG